MGKTRGVHETTPELRNRMVGMYEAGLGLREIAASINCSQRTVKRWLNRFDKEGTVETRERCGRKRATTTEQDEAIIRLATQTPITAAKAVLPALGLNCSVDTVRERLHKAGIHNWSPSRKHIQRIPLGDADGATIQQAVWRPTGTQLGKKKVSKDPSKTKASNTVLRKKQPPRKARTKDSCVGNEVSSSVNKQPAVEQNFSFQPPPTVHSTVAVDSNQYNHPLTLVQAPQPLYHPASLNVSQSWPLDLVQSNQHYPQNSHDPSTLNHAAQSLLHPHHDVHSHAQPHQVSQHIQSQNQHPVHPLHVNISNTIPQLSHNSGGRPREDPEVHSHDKQTQKNSSNSDRSNLSSNENSRGSSIDGESTSDGDTNHKRKKLSAADKKKGGKVKGTLETSVEIRNRMIGMSEAGLSTLSIALAINRSERTVKRWLDRWHKEGNVQTKERKGRRRITTKEEDEAIIAMATQHPLTAAKYVAPALGLKCSVDTIRERLHKAGIHSWKLGKKHGEGNAVHTVHLWQPSGNRPNKPKLLADKKKKKSSSRNRDSSTANGAKQSPKKRRVETAPVKIVPPPANMLPAEEKMQQYQSHSQVVPFVSAPSIMQPLHNLTPPSTLAQSLPPPPSPPQPQPQPPHQSIPVHTHPIVQPPPPPLPMQPMGPILQQRPDCRLAPSLIGAAASGDAHAIYPSCMIASAAASGNMEHSDPMNYEPYIWSF